jgi:hypothetical protein
MVFWLARLALEITLGGHDILLVRAVHFFVIIIAIGSDYDPSGSPLLPLLTTLSPYLSAFAGGFGRCFPAPTGDRFPITQNKDDPDRLLAKGVSDGDIKQLLGGVWLIPTELMH